MTRPWTDVRLNRRLTEQAMEMTLADFIEPLLLDEGAGESIEVSVDVLYEDGTMRTVKLQAAVEYRGRLRA